MVISIDYDLLYKNGQKMDKRLRRRNFSRHFFSHRFSSGLFPLLLFHGPDWAVIPTAVAFVTHPAGIVKSVGVDASVGFLLSTVKCVALLTHSLSIMQGILVRTLVYSPLLTASIRLVLNHIWQSIRCASLFLGRQISIFPSNTILYLRFLIDSLLYSSLIAPWNEPLI